MEFSYHFESLSQWFENVVHRIPDRVAIVGTKGQSLKYKEVDDVSRQISMLFHEVGVTKNDKVVIFLDRCLEFVLSYLAIIRSGKFS